MARRHRPRPSTREEQLKEKIREFVRSPQGVMDYEKILIAGSFAYRQGIGLPYEAVRQMIEDVLVEEGKITLGEPIAEVEVPSCFEL